MADEQAREETPITTEETPAEQPQQTEEAPQEQHSQEAPRQEEPDRGDLRIPLQEERRKRQEYERQLARLNDPAFVYEQAVKLGLAEGSYQAPQAQADPMQDVSGQVQFALQVEKAKEKYPDVTEDPVLSEAAWVLVQKGHSPLEAADIVHKNQEKRLSKLVDERFSQRVAEQQQTEQQKRAAELAESGSPSADGGREDELRAQARNWKDPKAQERANLELLKLRMK